MSPPQAILLVGLMASGKTTVGRVLARRLQRPYLDNDQIVRQLTGTALDELLRRDGLQALRAAELAALEHVLAAPPPWVAAAAAAAVLDARAAALLAGSAVGCVWLRAQPQTLAARLGARTERPFLGGGDAAGVFARMQDDRHAAYERLADVTVDVDGRSPEDVASEILSVWGSRSSGDLDRS